MPNPKKLDISPSISILVAGVTIAGAILITHFFPSGAPVVKGDAQNTEPTMQQQMSPTLYAALAKQFGVDTTKYASCVDNKTYQAKIDAETAEAQKAGGQGTPFTVVLDTKTNKMLPISGALPYEQLKAAIASVNTQGTAVTIRKPSDTDHIIGSPTAPIVLVEYSDFQCPYCQMIHPDLQKIVSESNGQIAWVYRNFPLYQIHPQATPAANAAECIAEQLGNTGFWKFANTIFEG
jgi:protein-disulfide isomerase